MDSADLMSYASCNLNSVKQKRAQLLAHQVYVDLLSVPLPVATLFHKPVILIITRSESSSVSVAVNVF